MCVHEEGNYKVLRIVPVMRGPSVYRLQGTKKQSCQLISIDVAGINCRTVG